MFLKTHIKSFFPNGGFEFPNDDNLRLSSYSKCNFDLDQRCLVIFYQGDEKNRCIALPTELFFKEALMKKSKQIGVN